VTPPWFAALLLFLLSPSPQAACRPETRVVEGRALDVYVCEDLVIAAQGLTVTSSDCIPGAPACMGQNFGMGPAGETRDILMREVTDPYPFATHLATFPYSYCLPRLQAVPRDPYLQLGDRDLRATSPITGLVFGARGMVATGLTDPQIYPLECYFFHGIRLAELMESRQQIAGAAAGHPRLHRPSDPRRPAGPADPADHGLLRLLPGILRRQGFPRGSGHLGGPSERRGEE